MAPAWKDEAGWTLPELMIGMVMSLAIAASSLLVLQTTLHSQKATGSRLAAQDDGSFAMLRMTKDIRTATAATVQDARTPRAPTAAAGPWTSTTAPTLRTTRTDRLRCEAGSMVVEALVAAAILIGGGLSTIAAFDSTTRASHTAEREAEAVAIAEKEL